MTLRELHVMIGRVMLINDRLPAIDGLARNDQQVTIELQSYGPLRKNGRRAYKTRYIPMDFLRSGTMTVGGIHCTLITAQEDKEIKVK